MSVLSFSGIYQYHYLYGHAEFESFEIVCFNHSFDSLNYIKYDTISDYCNQNLFDLVID